MEKERNPSKQGKGHGGLEEVFKFNALFTTGFCWRFWRLRRPGGRCYGPLGVLVLAVLNIHIFMVKKNFVPFLHVLQHDFCSNLFLCSLAVFSAIHKAFSPFFTHLFISFWTPRRWWPQCGAPRGVPDAS